MPVQMHINTCSITHHRLYSHQVFIHPVQIAFLVPYVAIHLFLEGTQFLYIQFAFSLTDSFRYLRVTAQIHLLGIVGTTRKRRVDVHQIDCYTFIFQISACGKAFSAKHKIAVFIFTDTLLKFGFIERHSATDMFGHSVIAVIAQYTFCAYKVVKHSLTFQCIWEIGYIFYSHRDSCLYYFNNCLFSLSAFSNIHIWWMAIWLSLISLSHCGIPCSMNRAFRFSMLDKQISSLTVA